VCLWDGKWTLSRPTFKSSTELTVPAVGLSVPRPLVPSSTKSYCIVFQYIATSFYRAMHFSAKRGLAIACRPSVCLSVCDVGDL